MKTSVYTACTRALEEPELYHRAWELASAQRKEKTDRFALMSGKRLSLGAEALLRYALRQAGYDRTVMEYTYGKYGKPYLPEAGLFFNLSHSGEYVMAAVSEYETGCDIEKISHSYEAVARRFFQKHEYEQLQSLQGTERDELFYRFWVLKESYMKVTGKGICLGPETFGFDLLHGQIIFNGPGEGDEYSFREYSGPQGYRSAVCIHGTAEIADMIETDLKVLLV